MNYMNFSLSSVVLVLFLLTGCQTPVWEEANGHTALQVQKLSASSRDEGSFDKIAAKMSYEYERPIDPDMAVFVDRFISKSYMDMSHETVKRVGMDAVRDSFVASYAASGRKQNWEFRGSGLFVWFNAIFASYRTMFYLDKATGTVGVGQENVTYDRRTKRRILLADLFDDMSRPKLLASLRDRLAEQGVTLPDLRVTDNFMLIDDGIVWTYNAYELPGLPAVNVVVPWDDLRPFLRPHAPTPVTTTCDDWDRACEESELNADSTRTDDILLLDD